MNKINLSTVRLFLVLIFLVSFSFIFASIFFVVTNSDVNEYIPYGQAQLSFENNELEEIDFEMTGNGSWSVDCNESYTGLCSIKSDSISHNENSTINISISIILIINYKCFKILRHIFSTRFGRRFLMLFLRK